MDESKEVRRRAEEVIRGSACLRSRVRALVDGFSDEAGNTPLTMGIRILAGDPAEECFWWSVYRHGNNRTFSYLRFASVRVRTMMKSGPATFDELLALTELPTLAAVHVSWRDHHAGYSKEDVLADAERDWRGPATLCEFWFKSKQEFIEKTWHPSRVLAWCLPHDETQDILG